jgi:biotin carboxyl carrier protein
VEPGDVVGLVETMKMYNEVTADVTGTVREIVVENGSLVEAGQPLLYVEPGHADDAPPTGVV